MVDSAPSVPSPGTARSCSVVTVERGGGDDLLVVASAGALGGGRSSSTVSSVVVVSSTVVVVVLGGRRGRAARSGAAGLVARAALRRAGRGGEQPSATSDQPASGGQRARAVAPSWSLLSSHPLLGPSGGAARVPGPRAASVSAGGGGRSRWCGRRSCGAAAGVPSRGQWRPGPGPPGGRPVWLPPRVGELGDRGPRWRWRRRASVGRERRRPAGRGRCPARQRTSSASRLPTPAIRCWSSSQAFTGAAAGRQRRPRSCGRADGEGVGAEAVARRVELHAAEPARVDDLEPAAARRSARANRIQRRLDPGGGVLEPLDRALPVDQQPAGHPEAQPEHRPVGVEQQQLADAAGARDRRARAAPPAAPRRGAALEVPVVGRVDPADRAADRPVGRPPVLLHLDHLRHDLPEWQTCPTPSSPIDRRRRRPPRHLEPARRAATP